MDLIRRKWVDNMELNFVEGHYSVIEGKAWGVPYTIYYTVDWCEVRLPSHDIIDAIEGSVLTLIMSVSRTVLGIQSPKAENSGHIRTGLSKVVIGS